MKYIDERYLRSAFIGLFALGTVLIFAAIWDTSYNSQRLLPALAGAIVGVFLVSGLLLAITRMVLKDALDLEPALAGPIAMVDSVTFEMESPSATLVSSGASVLMLSGQSSEGATIVTTLPPRAPLVPVPEKPQSRTAAFTAHLRELIGQTRNNQEFERGDPALVVNSAPSPGPKSAARVLCGSCGMYFQVEAETARPAKVQCPGCESSLGLSGKRVSAPGLRRGCRSCGRRNWIPMDTEYRRHQCPECGTVAFQGQGYG